MNEVRRPLLMSPRDMRSLAYVARHGADTPELAEWVRVKISEWNAAPSHTDSEPASIVRSARHRAGLSQRQLGKRLGIEASNVCHLEGGRRPRVSLEKVEQAVNACGLRLWIGLVP
jgi:ribosome-binding protein aMBF1 (putative translation factor)